jgi:formylglycine-generating enzyme required for sulfatase activity
MPGRDRIGEDSNRQSLDRVLDLFLMLAFEPGETWKTIEKGIRKKTQASRPAPKDIDKRVKGEIESLKSSLEIELVNAEALCSGDLRMSIDTAKLKQQAARRSGKAFLLLKRADRGVSTKDAIHKCIDYYDSAPSDGATHQKIGGLPSEKAQRAVSSLQELDLYMPRKDRKDKGTPYRHFALDFSSCQPLSQKNCKVFVMAQFVERYLPSEPPSAKPNTAPKGKDAALRKELDALVAALLPQAKENFKRRRRVDKKHIHVPLKAIIVPADWDQEKQNLPEARVPQAEHLVDLGAAEDTRLLLIWEEGGAGKTSLAYEIASWGLDGRLAEKQQYLLPYFLNIGGDNLEDLPPLKRQILDFLANIKVNMHIDEGDVDNLLRHKRVLVIVDHYSELTETQRAWVLRELCGCSLVLLTSRLRDYNVDFIHRGWEVTEIRPQRLENQELFDFFEQYLAKWSGDRQDGCNVVLGPDDFIRTQNLLERMVGHKPVTVLLAWLVIEEAIKHIEQRGSGSAPGPVDLLPSSVPQLMEAYVKENCRYKSAIEGSSKPLRYNPYPGIILSFLKALALKAHRQDKAYYPQSFDETLAKEALAAARLDGKPLPPQDFNVFLDDLISKLTLVTRIEATYGAETYRISLDPLADYLAALAQQEFWLSSGNADEHFLEVRGWLKGLKARLELGKKEDDHELAALDNMKRFLAACRDCYTQWLSQQADHLSESEKQQWQECLDDFAALAKIDPKEERKLEVKHLIRRHAFDLEGNNPELRTKAIAELTAYAQELKAKHQSETSRSAGDCLPQMAIAVPPLELTMADANIPQADRAAAAEALGHIGGPRATEALHTMMANSHESKVAVRRAAAEALGLLDASPTDPQAHWDQLEAVLQNQDHHLHAETDWAAIDQKLPLLQGASRGLQRLAARASTDRLKVWGAENSLEVPMLTLTMAAGAVSTRVVPIEVWQLPLPGGLPLELVKIPGGAYTIGSPPKEVGRKAYGHRLEAAEVNVEEQREVTVPSFGMARYPITQAQWQTLAAPEHQRDGGHVLMLDPSQHKGNDLPVDSVSWEDAREWIKRLNCWISGLDLQQAASWGAGSPPVLELPSESAWEVACRAGRPTPTPFHFGDTIDTAWANCDGNPQFAYPGGRAGGYLQRPSEVGAYGLVNAWGLADLHGTVWEWCADVWQSSPLGGPQDGTPRVQMTEGLLENRLLRGGSWFDVPLSCRSAFRFSDHQGILHGNIGFRVCCLPPGLPSWSLNP